MNSRICLSLTAPRLEEDLELVDKYRHHIDIVELRADKLHVRERTHVARFPALTGGMPAILTVRKKEDGGDYTGPENERLQLILENAGSGYTFVDIEEGIHSESLRDLMNIPGLRLIRSFHDFSGVPDNLSDRIAALSQSKGEIPKAAVYPRSTADLIRLLNAIATTTGEKIILGMGEFGFPSRILAPKLGVFLSYTSETGMSAAPGQIDPKTLAEVYRFRSIRRETRIFGIIGNPVLHTQSPAIHNRGFEKVGLDAVYIPFHTDDIHDFAELAGMLKIQGCSVTIPFKEEIIHLLDDEGDEIRKIGSCNTIMMTPSGWRGRNFDFAGFIAPLKRVLEEKGASPRAATVVGAGGAAKAVIYALTHLGLDVLIVNRTAERARAAAERFGCSWAPLSPEAYDRIAGHSDIIVQTTSVGMHPYVDADPLEGFDLHDSMIVYDLIYTPEKTLLMKRAERAGCTVIGGKEMLLQQAYHQFRAFTGEEYPVAS